MSRQPVFRKGKVHVCARMCGRWIQEGEEVTDEEIICTWMAPRPPQTFEAAISYDGDWWHCGAGEWAPRPLTLDALWEVEERLTEYQACAYEAKLNMAVKVGAHKNANGPTADIFTWHATPEQKIKALAAVLRPIVEAK